MKRKKTGSGDAETGPNIFQNTKSKLVYLQLRLETAILPRARHRFPIT